MKSLLHLFLVVCSLPIASTGQTSPPASAARNGEQDTLPQELKSAIDKAATDVLSKTGAPSISLAIVQDAKLAYVHAYGMADLAERKPAIPTMRYSIGSISKQFTAAAILLLAEEGKLSLDDKVGRWLPDLTRANDVTIRELLSMTAGYEDCWPQDYVMPGMMKAITPQVILDGWARKPLDFEPGTKWQYSNTNYVIAGLIAEKAAGKPLWDFLQERILQPLDIKSAYNVDRAALPAGEPLRYERFGLGPPRPAPKEGAGWTFAGGELAMTAVDLAKWDISMIDQNILKPASYRQMQTEVLLPNGAGTGYGLGVSVNLLDGRRVISHGGEVSGFTAQNALLPDERCAVIVFANLDATGAPSDLAHKIVDLVFAPQGEQTSFIQAQEIFAGLQAGKLDRSLFTSNANAYFSEQALKDLAASLGPLGKPAGFSQAGSGLRGGMKFHRYTVQFSSQTLAVTTYTMPDGKLEQYIVAAKED